jgi:hypothetical protein
VNEAKIQKEKLHLKEGKILSKACSHGKIYRKISIFAANRPDMSSGLGGESTDLRRDMKTIKIKDIIYRLWSEGNPII